MKKIIRFIQAVLEGRKCVRCGKYIIGEAESVNVFDQVIGRHKGIKHIKACLLKKGSPEWIKKYWIGHALSVLTRPDYFSKSAYKDAVIIYSTFLEVDELKRLKEIVNFLDVKYPNTYDNHLPTFEPDSGCMKCDCYGYDLSPKSEEYSPSTSLRVKEKIETIYYQIWDDALYSEYKKEAIEKFKNRRLGQIITLFQKARQEGYEKGYQDSAKRNSFLKHIKKRIPKRYPPQTILSSEHFSMGFNKCLEKINEIINEEQYENKTTGR